MSVTVQVPERLTAEPFDEPRQALIPSGWTLSVWARVPKARLAVMESAAAQLPSVLFLWQNGGLGAQTLVGGFQADDGRPVGAVTGSDGAVYITDDYADAVYRLAPPGP